MLPCGVHGVDVNMEWVILTLICIRMVVRIMLMVPIYAISSLISLFSLEAAFVIDAIRDIYEARRASSKGPVRS